MTIREIGVVGLDEALELTALMALKGESPRARRAAARWLQRYIAAVMIDDPVFAAGCLAALGGRAHGEALSTLRTLTDTARTPTSRRV